MAPLMDESMSSNRLTTILEACFSPESLETDADEELRAFLNEKQLK
jgi:hypothetical protein